MRAHVAPMRTRIPFRYGIAEMTGAPHVLVEVEVDGVTGWASEHLPPKWFVKDPGQAYADEVADMVGSVLAAAAHAEGLSAPDAFRLWLGLDDAQEGPGLLGGLGTALVERALIDAVCRGAGLPFEDALDRGVLGFDPALVHPELADRPVPRAARPDTIAIRHTVGLGDPLVDADVVDDPGDGLPISLEASVRAYGLRWLKLKTVGDAAADVERIRRVEEVCARAGVTPRYTIDGNESMRDGEALVVWLEGLRAGVPEVFGRLAAIEQPMHRDAALDPAVAPALVRAAALVPVIIDESDADREAIRRGLDLGYAGGTYKGCKGVFRGLANAALIAARGQGGVLTAEDLSTVPPLTVGQDLVVCAAMGLGHVERNGHHYFGRLAPLAPGLPAAALAAHPDAYRDDDGVVRLRVSDGVVRLGSLRAAPFGFAPTVRPEGMAELTPEAAAALV